jgi:protein-tyrosine phosphatase
MTGVANFRDFGGVPAANGTRVRAGLLFRCGQPGPLGDLSLDQLLAHDFAVIADLRFPDEARDAPMPWPDDYAGRIVSLTEPGDGVAPHIAFFRPGLHDPAVIRARYRAFYRSLPADPRYRPLFARTLCRIADCDGPALIHCSAGKDRTGLVCALILRCLGVATDAIIADYMCSADDAATAALRPEIRRRIAAHGAYLPDDAMLDAMVTVQPDYLLGALEEIDQIAGSLGGYLESIGVDDRTIAALRARLLQ